MYVGVINLDTPIFVRGDALQQTYDAQIGTCAVTIIFPRLPDEPPGEWENPLLSPNRTLYPDDKTWGHVAKWSAESFAPETTGALVTKIAIQWEAGDFNSSCEEILQGVDNWRKLFDATICLNQKFFFSKACVTVQERGGIILSDVEYHKHYDCHPNTHMKLAFSNISQAKTPDQILDILQLIAAQNPLKLEYELLLDAYRERAQNRNRFALIQAISAVEVCINSRINAVCNEKRIEFERLLARRSLGDKFELLLALGIEWATSDPNSEITRYRNNIFHAKTLTLRTDEMADVISAIEKYIEKYSPSYFVDET